jgi:adenine-specific DNA-methyltransferase
MTFDSSKQFDISNAERRTGALQLSSLSIGDAGPLIAEFPRTRFYGSKRRLLNWIHLSLKDLTFDTVLDGFGGTASVSLLFRAMGKKVTFHDGLLCNTIAANALLTTAIAARDVHDMTNFINSIKPIRGFVSETFSGMYYTDSENRWLDGAALAIHRETDPVRRSVYFYCLFQACLKKRPFNLFHRANLNLRLNQNVARSFGNWVTWERSFPSLMKAAITDLTSLPAVPSHPAKILSHGDITRVGGDFDLVYLDPPYVNKSKVTDDYMQRYHFLEGLSKYPDWKRQLDTASPLKALRSYPYISQWQDRRQFKDRLFTVISTHKRSTVVLSYLADAVPSRSQILAHFKANFKRVRVHTKQLGHALAKSKKTELLFIGSPK